MKRTVVVTGAAGFVGSTVVRRFLTHGYAVHAIVRPGGSLWRINDIRSLIRLHPIGLEDPARLRRLMHRIRPWAIVHFATYGSYPKQSDVSQMIQTNIVGTVNLLSSLTDVAYRHCIVIGSSSEYGKKRKPMTEDELLEPNNYYAATKAAQTHLSLAFSTSNKKPLVVLRLFNVYGPYEEEGRLVRSVIALALIDKPILLATGKEARDFVHVEDVATACMCILTRKAIVGEIINLGTGKQTTIEELARLIVGLTHSKSEIRKHAYPGRPWDSTHWQADTTKMRRLLRWTPQIPLSAGLRKTIAWYRIHI